MRRTESERLDSWLRGVAKFAARHKRTLKDKQGVRRLTGLDTTQDEPVRVATMGLVNSGKSSLLNALMGQHELFPTGDARKTAQIQVERVDHYAYVDTPGLDALAQDEATAREQLGDVDVILFAHAATLGGLDVPERAALALVEKIFPSGDERTLRFVPALTMIDRIPVPEDLEAVRRKFAAECREALGVTPVLFKVSARRFMKGVAEERPRLRDLSGVPTLSGHLAEATTSMLAFRERDLVRRAERVLAEIDETLLAREVALRERRDAVLRHATTETARMKARASEYLQSITEARRNFERSRTK